MLQHTRLLQDQSGCPDPSSGPESPQPALSAPPDLSAPSPPLDPGAGSQSSNPARSDTHHSSDSPRLRSPDSGRSLAPRRRARLGWALLGGPQLRQRVPVPGAGPANEPIAGRGAGPCSQSEPEFRFCPPSPPTPGHAPSAPRRPFNPCSAGVQLGLGAGFGRGWRGVRSLPAPGARCGAPLPRGNRP